ncbi:HpcH/HpaI aldolase family protein [Oceanomicrobium pacificus]|uniref:Hpch/hpai aldolase n=1 Tax=Oceanomicrobium pacificus TaxID=2692916 RepID=A0A6B0TSY5_9RHOB|nr:aldolase/citrate lyase family protein [Oceanomicrobium pacificus]MXU64332.1 hpch/hpai aldolase [Oceanomicrobium pacificus]
MAGRAMSGFRDLVAADGLKLGTYIGEFATPGIGDILAATGCEFVFVDMEHSGFTFETAAQVLRNLHGAGLATMLRVPSGSQENLQRAADIGAQGVIVPMVGSAAEAARSVAGIKYPPEGRRGVALGLAHDDYRAAPVADALAAANAKTGLVALIETAEGVAACEDIAATAGLDAIWIGHLDLSTSLGCPGAFDDPAFTGAVDRIMAAAQAAGVPVGRLVGSAEEAAAVHAQGCKLVAYLGDIWLLQKALRDGFAAIRAATAT